MKKSFRHFVVKLLVSLVVRYIEKTRDESIYDYRYQGQINRRLKQLKEERA